MTEFVCSSPCSLRAAGTPTPDIAAWQNIPFSPTTLSSIDATDYLFYYVLMLYNTKCVPFTLLVQ